MPSLCRTDGECVLSCASCTGRAGVGNFNPYPSTYSLLPTAQSVWPGRAPSGSNSTHQAASNDLKVTTLACDDDRNTIIKQVELLTFTKGNPFSWTYQTGSFCDVQDMPVNLKMKLSNFSMMGIRLEEYKRAI